MEKYLDEKGNPVTYLSEEGLPIPDPDTNYGPEDPANAIQGPEDTRSAFTKFTDAHPTLTNFVNKALTPLVDVTPEMRQHMAEFTKESPIMGRLGEFMTSLVTGGTSPVGMALMPIAEARPALEAAGYLKAAQAVSGISRTAGAGFGATGVNQIYHALTDQDKTTAERIGEGTVGALTAALGGHSALSKGRPPMNMSPEVADNILRQVTASPASRSNISFSDYGPKVEIKVRPGVPEKNTAQFGLKPRGLTPSLPTVTFNDVEVARAGRDTFNIPSNDQYFKLLRQFDKLSPSDRLKSQADYLRNGRDINSIPDGDPYWQVKRQLMESLGNGSGEAKLNPPNRLNEASPNATVFNALLPDRFKTNAQGAERLNTSSLEKLTTPGTDLSPENYGRVMNSLKASNDADFEKLVANAVADAKSEIPGFQDVQYSKTSDGKIKLDYHKDLGGILGNSLYSGDIAKIASKELVQNAVDAVRPLGDKGKIRVIFDESGNMKRPRKADGTTDYDAEPSVDHPTDYPYVRVMDNGPGMTEDQIATVFTNLGESGKRTDASASGGFGLAKASFLLGGKWAKLESVAREADGHLYKHIYEGDRKDIANGIELKSERVPEGTPTGVSVTTHFDHKSEMYSARRYIKELLSNSTRPGHADVGNSYDYNLTNPWSDTPWSGKTNYPPSLITDENSHVIPLENKSAKVDILIDKNAGYGESHGVTYGVLNNGLYQFTGRSGGFNEYRGIPQKIRVNIKSLVPEDHPDYPFTANREQLRGSVARQIDDYIKENIIKPSLDHRINELKQAYAGITPIDIRKINAAERDFHIYDVGKKATPEELNSIINHPVVQDLSSAISNILHDVLTSHGPESWNNKLEKVGLLFDDEGKLGIHIPNPGADKSAILINPFASIAKYADKKPVNAAQDIFQTIVHEIAHIPGGSHDDAWRTRYDELLADYGDNDYAARTKIAQILGTRGREDYNAGVGEILDKYLSIRGRESSVADPLIGTGIFSKRSPSEGENGVPPSTGSDSTKAGKKIWSSTTPDLKLAIAKDLLNQDKTDLNSLYDKYSTRLNKTQFKSLVKSIVSSGYLKAAPIEPPTPGPVGKLLDAVREHVTARNEQDLLVSKEKARRLENVANVKGSGVQKLYGQLRQLKGEYPKVDVERIKSALSDVDMDTLVDMAEQSGMRDFEVMRTKIAVGKALGVITSKGALQPNEIELLRKAYGKELADQLVELHGGVGAVSSSMGKAFNAMKEINNAARTLWTSIDLSAPLRQGGKFLYDKEFYPALKDMFKFAASENQYQNLITELNNRKNAQLGRRSGLFISNIITDNPSLKEEAYLSKLLEKVPGVRHSERAYVGFLDKLRADLFDRMIGDAEKAGIETRNVTFKNVRGKSVRVEEPTEFTKQVAKYINATSGRGSLPPGINKYADLLNFAMFSPRQQMGNIQYGGGVARAFTDMLVPEKYANLDPMVRKQYLKSMLALGSLLATSIGASAAAGHRDDLSFNPLSSDFLKGRFGAKTRQDAGTGLLQYATLAARLLMNKRTTEGGDTISLDRYNKNGNLAKDQHAGVTGRVNLIGRFLRSKESPLGSFIQDWYTMRDYLGRPFKFDEAIAQRFIPAVIQDLLALKDEDPDLTPMLDENYKPTVSGVTKPKLLPLAAGSLFGMGTNVYNDPQR